MAAVTTGRCPEITAEAKVRDTVVRQHQQFTDPPQSRL